MKISMYEASIPTFLHTLRSLKALLQKGVAHAESKKYEPALLATGGESNIARQAVPCGVQWPLALPRAMAHDRESLGVQIQFARIVAFLHAKS